MNLTEHVIQNEIFRAFGTIPGLRVWRANSGVAKFGKHTVRFGVNGQTDVTGILPVTPLCPNCGTACHPVGARLEIEVKSDTGRQSQEQKYYEQIIRRHHGIYVLARSVEDVRAVVGKHLGGQG